MDPIERKKPIILSVGFAYGLRQALLIIVDLLETELNICPTTADIRKEWRLLTKNKNKTKSEI